MVESFLKQASDKTIFPIPGNTPLLKLTENQFGIKELYVKDESCNPTHTFKDRLAFEMLKPTIECLAQNKPITRTTFASISYGNTAMSMGYYCDLLNSTIDREISNAISYIPHTLNGKIFGPDSNKKTATAEEFLSKAKKNCKLIEIDLTKKILRSQDLEEIARAKNLSFEKFIDVTEGLDRPAYEKIISEAIEDQLKAPPDFIIIPFGAGILCNEIMDYISDHKLNSKVVPISSGNPDTMAIMLYGPIWLDTESLLKNGSGWTRHNSPDKKGRKKEKYLVYHVEEKEIYFALDILRKNNINAEPSSAAGFAILPRLKTIHQEFNPLKHSVLVINTGNGLLNLT